MILDSSEQCSKFLDDLIKAVQSYLIQKKYCQEYVSLIVKKIFPYSLSNPLNNFNKEIKVKQKLSI